MNFKFRGFEADVIVQFSIEKATCLCKVQKFERKKREENVIKTVFKSTVFKIYRKAFSEVHGYV